MRPRRLPRLRAERPGEIGLRLPEVMKQWRPRVVRGRAAALSRPNSERSAGLRLEAKPALPPPGGGAAATPRVALRPIGAISGSSSGAYGHRGMAVNPTGLFEFWKANWFGVPVWMFWWKP
jgi:hypothetical protein